MKGTLLVKLLTDYKLGPLELANPCMQGIRGNPFALERGHKESSIFWSG